MEDATRERLVDGNIWLRGLHMVLFIIAYNIAEIIIVLLAVFQFVCALFTGKVNEPLLRFGKNLAVYVEEVFEFLTFNTEIKPFPFEPWPDESVGGEQWTGVEDEPVDEAESVVIDQESQQDSNTDSESEGDGKSPKS